MGTVPWPGFWIGRSPVHTQHCKYNKPNTVKQYNLSGVERFWILPTQPHLASYHDFMFNKDAYLRDLALPDQSKSASGLDLLTCILSRRSIWSAKSIDFLLKLGPTKRLFAGVTTRVFRGSDINWTRWSEMAYIIRYI